MKQMTHPVPQLRVHTHLVAGMANADCQQKVNHWRNQLAQKCAQKQYRPAPGYAPYLETEMKPWQAGSV